jgi:hypothetical protein
MVPQYGCLLMVAVSAAFLRRFFVVTHIVAWGLIWLAWHSFELASGAVVG